MATKNGSKHKRIKKIAIEVSVETLTFNDIQCCSTKCEEDLHCFRTQKHHAKKHGQHGVCIECGTNLIDWKRVKMRDITDAKFVFSQLKLETIRHFYFHKQILEADKSKAISQGLVGITDSIINRLDKDLGTENPFRGCVTPYTGDIVFYAQHATATCCRRCLEYWHGIEDKKRKLTEDEKLYFRELMLLYIKEKLPEIR